MPSNISVGVGLLVVKNKREVLLGRRISSHGSGEYAGIGGKLEVGESFTECIMRELREEAGNSLAISSPSVLCISKILDYPPIHWVDIGMCAEYISGEPIVMEPDKLESWDWYDVDDLPSPLFRSIKNYVVSYLGGATTFE